MTHAPGRRRVLALLAAFGTAGCTLRSSSATRTTTDGSTTGRGRGVDVEGGSVSWQFAREGRPVEVVLDDRHVYVSWLRTDGQTVVRALA